MAFRSTDRRVDCRNRSATIAIAVVLACGAAFAAETVPGRGILLPVQDRVDNVELAAAADRAFAQAMRGLVIDVGADRIRDVRRRLRIRDVRDTIPARLDELAGDLGGEWLFTPTLHRAVYRPVPEATFSAIVHRAGSDEVVWAGFASATGLDDRGLLDIGLRDDLGEVMRRAAFRLVQRYTGSTLTGGDAAERDPRHRRSETGYLRWTVNLEELGRVAVVPFDATTPENSGRAAEVVTALAVTSLRRYGIRVVSQGLTRDLLRRAGDPVAGQVSPEARERLKANAGVDYVFTGTVEAHAAAARGGEPVPTVGIAARLVHVRTGRIQWMDERELQGGAELGWFGKGRFHALVGLAERAMEELIGGFVRRPSEPSRGVR